MEQEAREAQAPEVSFFSTATPSVEWHPSLRQNCSALTLASLSGEGSGEGRRGLPLIPYFLFLSLDLRLQILPSRYPLK
jgi:hypothetical protein